MKSALGKPFDRVIAAITRYENIISAARGNDHDTAYPRNEDRVCTAPCCSRAPRRRCSSVGGYRRLLPTFSLSSAATFPSPFSSHLPAVHLSPYLPARPTPPCRISCNIRSLRVKRDTARAVRSISRYNVATANTR